MKHVLRLFSGTIRYLRTRKTALAGRFMIHPAASSAGSAVEYHGGVQPIKSR